MAPEPSMDTFTSAEQHSSRNELNGQPNNPDAAEKNADQSDSDQIAIKPQQDVLIEQELCNYELPRLPLPPAADLEPIELFVSNAVQSQLVDTPEPMHVDGYRAIANSLRKSEDPSMLYMLLVALRTAGKGSTLYQLASINKFNMLVHLIFKFNPFDYPQPEENGEKDSKKKDLYKPYTDFSMADAHFRLILALISAKSVHIVPAVTAIWKLLTYNRETALEPMRLRCHAMLNTMMKLCPKAKTDIFPVMASNAPFYTKTFQVIDFYYAQCFFVLNYHPGIRRNVLEMVIDKALEIDVHIKIKDGGEAVVEEEQQEETDSGEEIFEMDMDTPAKKKHNIQNEQLQVNELSDKLDYILFHLFSFINKTGRDEASVRELYRDIVPVFESNILTTHKSKFVQYCMFLLCGLESQVIVDGSNSPAAPAEAILHRDFAAKLVEIIIDPYRASITRQSAACYLASLASRATYVNAETICESVFALLRWAEAYIASLQQDGIRASDTRNQADLHALFYTVCQGAFYIMCFHGQEAVEFYRSAVDYHASASLPQEHEWELPHPDHIDISSRRWTLICGHPLQPLRFCLESVRSEFVHVAHAFELIDPVTLQKLVEDAKKLSTGRVSKKAASKISTVATLAKQRQTGGVGGLGRGSNPLKTFFPFDPFLLMRSHDFVQPFYNYWQGPIEEDEMVEDEDDTPRPDEIDSDDDSNSDSDSDSDDEDNKSVDSSTNMDPMSYLSTESGNPLLAKTPDAATVKESLKQAWTDTIKRPRSLSIENGSW